MNGETQNKDRINDDYVAHFKQSRSHTCQSRIIQYKKFTVDLISTYV